MHIARNIRSVLLAMCLLHASFANSANQATPFKAILQANHENGDRLANAQISAAGEAAPKTSGSDGLFTLEFPTKKPGDKISLHISKPGWRVLHPIMVERLSPAKQDVPDKIILCQEAQCDASVAEYFASKAVNGIKLDYEKRIAALKGEAKGASQGQLKAKDQQIPKLQQERDELLKKAPDAAAQLARVPQGAVSNAYLQAMELFRNGHIQQALEKLNEEEMSAREAKHKQEREEMINSRLLKAKLQVLRGQFDAAQLQFEKAVQLDAQSYDAWFAYAYFLGRQRQISKAITAYESCLTLVRTTKGKAEVASVLNNLAAMYYDDNRLPAALTAYEEGLKIRRELAAQNRATYLPEVAGTLNNLGLLHDKENRLPAALASYEEALKSYRELAAQNRAAYLPNMAMTLNNLGNLHAKENRLSAARATYEEGLKSYRELAAQNRAAYFPDVAMTLNNLGNLHYKENRLPAALAAYEEALKIRRELAAQNRAAYLQYVAAALNNLGNLHDKESRLPAALTAYEEALKSYRELVAQNRAAYLPDVATTLHNLGLFYINADQPAAALLALEDAETQRRELATNNAYAFAPSLADTLFALGILHASQQRPAPARKAYEQALGIYREFLSRNPAFFAVRIADLEKFLRELPP